MSRYKVPIKNALFMYSYVWDRKKRSEFIELADTDDFNFSDLYAELFLMNVRKVLKRGLTRDYKNRYDALSVVRGRIDYTTTIRKQSLNTGRIHCDYDEYEENNILNQIVKYTAMLIYRSKGLSDDYKKRIRYVIGRLSNVGYKECDIYDFRNIRFNRNNDYYFLLIKICELIIESKMLNEEDGTVSFYNIFEDDEKMNSVFEMFVYKFYEYELPNSYKVKYQHQLNFRE